MLFKWWKLIETKIFYEKKPLQNRNYSTKKALFSFLVTLTFTGKIYIFLFYKLYFEHYKVEKKI